MSDASDEEESADGTTATEGSGAAADPPDGDGQNRGGGVNDHDGVETDDRDEEEADLEALRQEVEGKYDFDDFGPRDMAEMTGEEWEAAFDPETWITGADLLDRVEAELNQRVADRDVFARIERRDGRILAYSDTGYATVYADGSVEGRGTVLRDVKPTVALCSMEEYDPPENPPEGELPAPQEVPEGTGQLGNWMLQAVAGTQVLAGLVLVGAWLLITVGVLSPPGGGTVRSLNVIGILVAGLIFLAIGILLFVVVANARLSDRFRAEEYRNRLRAIDLEPGERPEFLPEDEREALGEGDSGDDVTAGADDTDRTVEDDVSGGA